MGGEPRARTWGQKNKNEDKNVLREPDGAAPVSIHLIHHVLEFNFGGIPTQEAYHRAWPASVWGNGELYLSGPAVATSTSVIAVTADILEKSWIIGVPP